MDPRSRALGIDGGVSSASQVCSPRRQRDQLGETFTSLDDLEAIVGPAARA